VLNSRSEETIAFSNDYQRYSTLIPGVFNLPSRGRLRRLTPFDSLVCACDSSMFMRLIHVNMRGLRKHSGAADLRRRSGEYGVN
jgi:hypothetical protein